jgi:hypothetical protein
MEEVKMMKDTTKGWLLIWGLIVFAVLGTIYEIAKFIAYLRVAFFGF